MENKDPPKKLKKKLPKEAPSGESREKKLKPKGKCLGEGDGLNPAPLSLVSVLAGMKGPPVPHPHHCPRRLGGLQGNCPLPIPPPPNSHLPAAPTLPPPYPLSLPMPAHLSNHLSSPLSHQERRTTRMAKPNLPEAPRRSQCPCSR